MSNRPMFVQRIQTVGYTGARSLGGMPRPHDRALKVHRAGRTCSNDGCRVQLSIYNETDVCALHSAERWAYHGDGSE